jgi:hypothetical protein
MEPTAYRHAPDVLDLVVSPKELEQLHVQRLETAWGTDEASYCYVEGVLMGRLLGPSSVSAKYYRGLGVRYEGKVTISLTPALRRPSVLPIPDRSDFAIRLAQFLFSNKGWTLICEADCDQNPIENIGNDVELLGSRIGQLVAFCGGGNVECPTFLATA